MAINIKFDLTGNPEPPTIILANRNGNKLGQLYVDANSIDLSDKLNGASEFAFTLNKYVDNKLTPLWDKVVDFKLVYCKEWDMWFEISVELDEATETVKTVFCTQLGYAELSQLMLYNIEINTEKDIERDDYKITILYDKNDPDASLLHRLLNDKAPHYSIIHVDATIADIQRAFSFDDISIHDAFQEIAEEIGCLFVLHSNSGENGEIQRTISVYDLQQNCSNIDCGYRGEFTDVCPKCGGTEIKNGYGNDTLIFVTSDELAYGGISMVTDVGSVKNCFKLEAGDDLMTATVRNCNPNGTDYIWYFSDSTKEDMSDELVSKIEAYDEMYKDYYLNYKSNIDSQLLSKYNSLVTKYSSYKEDLKQITSPVVGYSALMNAYYDAVDMYLFLESSLMPSVEISETDASKQVRLLTTNSLSPVAVADVDIASLATANSAVLAMAKTIVKSTYKIEIGSSELVEDDNGAKTWKGNFVLTNYSDEEDTATSNTISVEINDDLKTFTEQKIEKTLSKEDTENLSITGLFEKEYNDFCAELKKYALNPLISFHDACQACIDILIEQGIAEDENLYEELYVPYYDKLTAIEKEMKTREDEIKIVKGEYTGSGSLKSDGLITCIEKIKAEIQDALNFENYIGKELWIEFCSYRREDKYLNNNYISDGLNNAELFKRASEFIEVAENEIYKSSELQHSISTTLKNLLAIPKFKSLVEHFEVGNWIRVLIDDVVCKFRLIEYGISYKDFSNITVEFSDITKVKNGTTDVEDILSQSSSMATSYDSTKKQAEQGNGAQATIRQWLDNGLNSASVQIQNNDNEEITLTKGGLLARSYNDITDTYSPEQLKITHNIMAYTDDNWKSVKQAIGKHDYVTYNKSSDEWFTDSGYGMSAEFVTAGQVMGSKIVGGEIYSSNYHKGKVGDTNNVPQGTYIDLTTGDFELAGKKFVYDAENETLTLRNVTIEWANTNSPEVEVKDITGFDEYLERLDNIEDQLDGRAETWYQNTDPSTEWITDELKSFHAGDLWHYTGETGTVNGVERTKDSEWIWQEEDGEYKWVSIEISDDVFDAIDGKAQVFTSEPIPPYNVGDLWIQGSEGDILHCVAERAEGESFSETDWEKSSKYTDDTAANDIASGIGATTIDEQYVISPHIVGGDLEIVADDGTTSARISSDGVLSATGANITGTITSSVVESSEFIGGSIKSTNYEEDIGGTYIGLDDEYIDIGGKTLLYSDGQLTIGKKDESSYINLCDGLGSISYLPATDKDNENDGENSDASIIDWLKIVGGNIIIESSNNGDEQLNYGRIRIKSSETIGGKAWENLIRVESQNIIMQSKCEDTQALIYINTSLAGSGEGSDIRLTATRTNIDSPEGIFTYLKDDNGNKKYEVLRMGGTNKEPILFIGDGLFTSGIGITRLGGKEVTILTPNNRIRLVDYSPENPDTFAYNAFFIPENRDGKYITLGKSDSPWYALYAQTSTIQSSDARKKMNVMPLGETGISMFSLGDRAEQVDIHSELFDRLQPVQYNLIGDETRLHYGLVAQDVVAAMNELGIDENELDLVHHDYWVNEKSGKEEESYGLAYNNLIAMLIHEVQKLKLKNVELEDEIKTIKNS